MKQAFLYRVFTVLLIAGVFSSTLFATEGYFRNGYGVKYSALAGAGVAINLSSLGAITNPAGLIYSGSRFDINAAVFSPLRDYTITGNPSGYPGTFGLTPGKIESKSNYFVMPTLGYAWKFKDNMSLGVVFYGNGGMNTNYDTRTFYDPSSASTGVNLEQMFLGAAYSVELVKDQAIGITALYAFQRFAAKGLASFAAFSSDPLNISGNRVSTSTGLGVKIGYQGKLFSFLTIGAAYQTKISMSEFKEYRGLFAEHGKFDIPSNWTVGIAVKANEQFTFAVDVQQILYSQVKSINNPLNPMELAPAFLKPGGNPNNPADYVPNPNYKPLGSPNGAGFGWKDVMAYKVGIIWKYSNEWTWMAGYAYNQQPFDGKEVLFNILAPAVTKNHLTAGVSKTINKKSEINLTVMYAPAGSIEGPNPLEAPNQQTIKLNMSQWQVELGYAFH